MDNWNKVGGGDFNESWNGKGAELKIGDSIAGDYTALRENVGKFKSNVYTIKTDKGEVDVWGGTVLDSRMEEIKIGSTIKIEFVGTAPSKMGGNPVKLYEVYIAGE